MDINRMFFESGSEGKEENSGSLQEQLQKQALETTLRTLESKVKTLVCPVHQQSPQLKTSEGAGPGKQNMFFHCCCDTLKKMMEETLKS
jgi:hypothetical protein